MFKWFRNIKDKNKQLNTDGNYIRNDELLTMQEKVKHAFGSIKKKVELHSEKCMSMTNKGTRCKNKALEGEDYCYRHKALHG